eukprot:Em0187g4a
MVWFSEDLLSQDMIFEQFLMQLRNTAINEDEKQHKVMAGDQQQQAKSSSPNMQPFSPSTALLLFPGRTWTLLHLSVTFARLEPPVDDEARYVHQEMRKWEELWEWLLERGAVVYVPPANIH